MNTTRIPIALFRLGHIVATPHVLEAVSQNEITAAIGRHQAGDWGNVPPEDRRANDAALAEGTRVFSVYRSSRGVVFWIITEADRSSTCVLLPEDY